MPTPELWIGLLGLFFLVHILMWGVGVMFGANMERFFRAEWRQIWHLLGRLLRSVLYLAGDALRWFCDAIGGIV